MSNNVIITTTTEPTTRPDGSPLVDGDQWVNGDTTREWFVIAYSSDDLTDTYVETFVDNIDANNYVWSTEHEASNTENYTPPEFTEVGQWLIPGEELSVTIDGVTLTPEPFPVIDEE